MPHLAKCPLPCCSAKILTMRQSRATSNPDVRLPTGSKTLGWTPDRLVSLACLHAVIGTLAPNRASAPGLLAWAQIVFLTETSALSSEEGAG